MALVLSSVRRQLDLDTWAGYRTRSIHPDCENGAVNIIPNAFGEKPILKLMFGATIRAAER